MAKRSYTKKGKFSKRKTYRKKRSTKRSYKRKGQSPTTYPGFPKNKIVKMTYVDYIPFDMSLTGSGYQYLYRANSIFDPQHATGGHQPLGADQWAQFYKKYMVLSSKCVAHFSSSQNATTLPCALTIHIDNNPTSPLPALGKMEQGNCSYGTMNQFASIGKPVCLTRTYSAKKWNNITDVGDNWDLLGGLTGGTGVGSNPPSDVYFNIAAENLTGGTSDATIYVLVKLTYTVMLAEPYALPPS